MLSRGVTGSDLLCSRIPPAAVPTAPGYGSRSRSRESGEGFVLGQVDVRSLAKKSLGLCLDLTYILHGTYNIRKHL